MAIESINPATGEKLREYSEMTATDVDSIIARADTAFRLWRREDFASRSNLMKRAAERLRRRKSDLAKLMAEEMGKPLAQGIAEAEKCAWVCDYYADEAERFLSPEIIATDATKSFVSFQPLGVLLAVMPWNFPFWQVFRCLAPSIMAGNTVILKHASNVPACALAIEEIMTEAGFPNGVFRTMLVGSMRVEYVISHPLVQAVTITGSTDAGKAVAAAAGKHLKKVVLELGGSDPYVVLEDANIRLAAETCASSRMINAGQSCIAAKRFIVVDSVADEFENFMVGFMQKQKMGDPLEEGVTVGPMARHDLRDELHEQVRVSVERGARMLLGGEVPDLTGAFYPPTVLTNVAKGQPAYDDETFGPVAAIIRVKDEAEAIRVANDTVFGLGAAVFTSDLKRGERIATVELEAGSCFVNTFVKSDPRLPFGGVKQSGYGRELSSFGIREFVNIKTVFVK